MRFHTDGTSGSRDSMSIDSVWSYEIGWRFLKEACFTALGSLEVGSGDGKFSRFHGYGNSELERMRN